MAIRKSCPVRGVHYRTQRGRLAHGASRGLDPWIGRRSTTWRASVTQSTGGKRLSINWLGHVIAGPKRDRTGAVIIYGQHDNGNSLARRVGPAEFKHLPLP
jgi:hypothetical protein